MKKEKMTNQNQIMEVATKIGKDIPYPVNYIEKLLRKYENYVEIEINQHNIDNDSITWHKHGNEYVVMFDNGRELNGINITRDEYINDEDCCSILGCN